MNDTLIMASTSLGKFVESVEQKIPSPTNDYQYTVWMFGAIVLGVAWIWLKSGKKREGMKMKEDPMTALQQRVVKLEQKQTLTEQLDIKVEGLKHEMTLRFSGFEKIMDEHKGYTKDNFKELFKKLDDSQKEIIDILKYNKG